MNDERKSFPSIAYAYRYYQQLTAGLELDQTSTLSEVTRLVNFELRAETEEARQLVNGWFDNHETLYMEEVLKSDIGDHLGQSNVFEMLTLDRKIRFFKRALAKCSRERSPDTRRVLLCSDGFCACAIPSHSGGRLARRKLGCLVNEWVLFEKYMQVLHNVGERKVLLARKQILKGGLDQLSLHPGNVQWSLITLKLSGVRLQEAGKLLARMERSSIGESAGTSPAALPRTSMISRRAGPFASSKESARRRISRSRSRMTSNKCKR